MSQCLFWNRFASCFILFPCITSFGIFFAVSNFVTAFYDAFLSRSFLVFKVLCVGCIFPDPRPGKCFFTHNHCCAFPLRLILPLPEQSVLVGRSFLMWDLNPPLLCLKPQECFKKQFVYAPPNLPKQWTNLCFFCMTFFPPREKSAIGVSSYRSKDRQFGLTLVDIYEWINGSSLMGVADGVTMIYLTRTCTDYGSLPLPPAHAWPTWMLCSNAWYGVRPYISTSWSISDRFSPGPNLSQLFRGSNSSTLHFSRRKPPPHSFKEWERLLCWNWKKLSTFWP